MRYCENCGAEKTTNSRYCLNCGSPLQEQPNIEEANIVTEQITPPEKVNSPMKKIILGVVVAVIICAAFGIGIILSSKKPDDNPPGEENIQEVTKEVTPTPSAEVTKEAEATKTPEPSQEPSQEEKERARVELEKIYCNYIETNIIASEGLATQEIVVGREENNLPRGVVSAIMKDLDRDGQEEMLVVVNKEDTKISLVVLAMKDEEVTKICEISQDEISANGEVGNLTEAPACELAVYLKEASEGTYIFAEFLKEHYGHYEENAITALEYKDEAFHIVGDLNFAPVTFMAGSDACYSKVLPRQWKDYSNEGLDIEDIKESMQEHQTTCVFGIERAGGGETGKLDTRYFGSIDEAVKGFFACFEIERDTLYQRLPEGERVAVGDPARYGWPNFYADESIIKVCDMYDAYLESEKEYPTPNDLIPILKWTDHTKLRENEAITMSAQEPAEEEAPAVESGISAEVNVPEEVLRIREWYNDTQNRLNSMERHDRSEGILFYDEGALSKISIPQGTDGWNYKREYFFKDGQLYFAFVSQGGITGTRFYYKDGYLIRYIGEDGVEYDNEAAAEHIEESNRVVKEAMRLQMS